MSKSSRFPFNLRSIIITTPSKGLRPRPVGISFAALGLMLLLASCSTQRQIGKSASTDLFPDSSLQHAHVGISLFDPSTNKYLYTHNAKKYFVPASNTKLF